MTAEENVKVKMTGDFRQVIGAVKDTTEAVGALAKGFGKIKQYADGVVGSIESVGHRMMLAGAAGQLSSGLMVASAAKVDTAFRNVNSIAQVNERTMLKWKDTAIQLSTQVPQAAEDIGNAWYDVASAGIDAADAGALLEQSTRAATAGLTDTQTATGAFITVMNAYGKSVDDAADISDTLFQTVNLGVLTFPELAAGMQQWVSIASAAKVPLSDAGAALALMTRNGMDADKASVALARTLEAFLKPSTEMNRIVSQLGYSSAEAFLNQEGLAGAIQKVTAATGGSTTQLSAIFQEVNALNGALVLGKNNGNDFADIMDKISDPTARAGATSKAFAEQSKAFSATLAQVRNQIKAMVIELGGYMLPIMTKGLNILKVFLGGWEKIPGPIKAVIAMFMLIGPVIMAVGGFILATQLKWMVFQRALALINPAAAQVVAGVQGITLKLVGLGFHIMKADAQFQKLTATMQRAKAAGMGMGMAFSAVLMGVTLGLQAIQSTNSAAAANFEQVMASYAGKTDTLKDLSNSFKDLKQHYEEWQQVGENNTLMGDLKVIGESIGSWLPGIENTMGEARHQSDLAEDQLNKWKTQSEQMVQSMQRISHQTGLSEESIYKLAQAAGIDLKNSMGAAGWAIAEVYLKAGKELPPGLKGAEAAFLKYVSATEAGTASTKDAIKKFSELHSAAPRAAEAVLELSDAEKDLAKALADVGDGARGINEFLERKRDSARDFIDAQKEAIDNQIEAIKESGKRQQEVLKEQADRFAETHKGNSRRAKEAQQAFETANESAITSIDRRVEAETKALEKSKEQWDNYVEDVKLTMQDYKTALDLQTLNTMIWMQDLVTLSQQLGAAKGPNGEKLFSDEDINAVRNFIVSQGKEGQEMLHQMVTADETGRAQLAESIKNNMKVTDEKVAIDLQAAFTVAQEEGRQGAMATVDTIAAALNSRNQDIYNIGKSWGELIKMGLQDGVSGGSSDVVLPGGTSGLAPHQQGPTASVMANAQRGYIVDKSGNPVRGSALTNLNANNGPYEIYDGKNWVALHSDIGGKIYQDLMRVMNGMAPINGAAPVPRRRGGSVMPGQWYLVGEEGPELARFGSMGHVVPHKISNDFLRSMNGGSGHTQKVWNKKNEYNFTGPMIMTDPRETVRYAERKKRTASLTGGV